MAKSDIQKVEFGDFQTPDRLAITAADAVAARGILPRSIVEPTCGVGSFLIAALKRFPTATKALGLEINPDYFRQVHQRVLDLDPRQEVDLRQADFFDFDWPRAFALLPEPILVLGNPPWVTASELGALQSENLPTKSNFQNLRGLDAITGKSNFDIAEWMLIRLLQSLSGRQATVAMLLKTSVARKVLFHAWKEGPPLASVGMFTIDAKMHFGVGVDACLLVCDLRPGLAVTQCEVCHLDAPSRVVSTLAFHRGMILADLQAFKDHEELLQAPTASPFYRWRSGVKHDCSRVMELEQTGEGLRNGLGELVSIEPDLLYPMLKGSAVARGGDEGVIGKYMLVTQTETGQPTGIIAQMAPLTWAYLSRHAEEMDRRASSIYRGRPRFSVFGVGPYTFAPWKVAICGLYKKLAFSVIGPNNGKPVVVDDTVYFLSCDSEAEAQLLAGLLRSKPAQEFLGSFIFWDSKRPITAEVLARLDLIALAEKCGDKEALFALRPAVRHGVETMAMGSSLF